MFSPSFWYAKDSFEFTEKATGLERSRLYYLVGGKEGNDMVKPMKDMVGLIKVKGFSEHNIYSKVVPDGSHSESFWKREFQKAIGWLFNIEGQ